MKLLICPETDEIRQLYKNHSTYHPGDSGLDLFVPEQRVITSEDTAFIDLQIRCEMIDDQGKMYRIICIQDQVYPKHRYALQTRWVLWMPVIEEK